jgi:hypothetical protein
MKTSLWLCLAAICSGCASDQPHTPRPDRGSCPIGLYCQTLHPDQDCHNLMSIEDCIRRRL